MFTKRFGVKKIAHSDSLFHVFIRINGCYTASCRTEFLVRKSFFFKYVHHLVVGHTYCCSVADNKVLGCNVYALVAKSLNLFCEMFDVNNHSGTHNVDGLISENA